MERRAAQDQPELRSRAGGAGRQGVLLPASLLRHIARQFENFGLLVWRASFRAWGRMSVQEHAKATHVQRLERGRQARSLRRIGPPFTPAQRRHLEDALSAALNAAMEVDASEGRLGFMARHLAAQDAGGRAEVARPRAGAAPSETDASEVALLTDAIARAVNAGNCKTGSPLHNVASHLLQQHRVWKSPKRPPQTAQERARAARMLAMKSSAAKAPTMKFDLPAEPTAAQSAAHNAKLALEESTDPLVIAAKKAAAEAFGRHDKDQSGTIDVHELFDVLLSGGHVNGTTAKDREGHLAREFKKMHLMRAFKHADKDGSGSVSFDEFVEFYAEVILKEEAEKVARAAFTT